MMATLFLLSGCAKLSISQSSLQGDLARGETSQVAVALGLLRGLPDIKDVQRPTWIDQDIVALTSKGSEGGKTYDKNKQSDLKKLMYAYIGEVEARECLILEDKKKQRETVCATLSRIKDLIGVQSFDQIDLANLDWKEINPVSVFGGLGKTEFIIVRDDGGNYNLKSASFDPNEVVQAGIDAGLGAIRILAAAYGVPPGLVVPSSTNKKPTTSTSPLTAPDRSSRVKEIQATTQAIDGAAKRLALDLKSIQSTIAGTTTFDPNAVSRLKVANQNYLFSVSSTVRGVRGLEGLARLLPEIDVLDQLAQQFNVASLSLKEQVALYWVYMIGLDNSQEEELARKTLNALNVQIDSRHVQPTRGRNDVLIRSTLTDLNEIISLEQASKDTKEDVHNLLDAQMYVKEAKSPFEEAYPEFKTAVDSLVTQSVTNADEAKTLATNAQQAIDNYKKKRVLFASLQDKLQLIQRDSDFTPSEQETFQALAANLSKQKSLMDTLAEVIEKHVKTTPFSPANAEALQQDTKTALLPTEAIAWPQNSLLTKPVREVRVP
jgi:hypothetical protein